MIFNHFKPRKLLVKESTAEDLSSLNIGEATIDPSIIIPPIPQNFSIRNEMTAVEDQGGLGACTSFCVAACLEHIHQRDLSEGQITHEAERAHGDCTEGLAVVHAYQICKTPGAVDEERWPYDDSQVCWAAPPNIGGATRYRFNEIGYIHHRSRSQILSGMLNPSSLPAIPGLPISIGVQRQIFARRKAVSVSVPVVFQAWPWNGTVNMPAPALLSQFPQGVEPPNTEGWHCIAICGWDNSTARFLFKNSWGTSWGNDGYGTIPYQYLEFYSDIGMVGW